MTNLEALFKCLLDVAHLRTYHRSGRFPCTRASANVTRCYPAESSGVALGHEPVMRVALALLLMGVDNLLGAGSVVDAGTHLGGDACFFAMVAPYRTVHAMDPVALNVAHVRAKRPDWVAMGARMLASPLHIALGRTSNETMRVPRKLWLGGMVSDGGLPQRTRAEGKEGKEEVDEVDEVHVRSLDDLVFGTWGTRLALAHLDVEGVEHAVLVGARRVIRAHRPWVTVEISARSYRQRDFGLLRHLGTELRAGEYTAFIVHESCGGPECRNFLGVPNERLDAFERSRLWHLMQSAGNLVSRCDEAAGVKGVKGVKSAAPFLWVCLQESVARARRPKHSA